jgi:tetratricopeptide (TPR) repeat protein
MKSNKRTNVRKSSKPGAQRQPGSNQGMPQWLPALSVAVVTSAAFFPALLNDFVNWDDDTILTNNPYYRGLGWEQLRWMFTTFLMGHYQPLSWMTFGVDYLIWGMDPLGYHLTNLLLHAASSVLFYYVSGRLLSAALSPEPGSNGWRLDASAAVAALFFAIHPLRVESVAWATERRDVLSGFFYLWTIAFYLRAASTRETSSGKRWLWVTLLAYVLSLLSKATAMTLPVVLLLLDIYPLRRLKGGPLEWLKGESRGVLLEKLPFFALAFGFAGAALFAQHTTGALKPLDQFDLISRTLQACFAVMFYLYKTIVPARLAPIYELPVDAGPWFWVFVVSGLAAVAITLALVIFARRWPALAASWFYYIIVLAPVTGIAQSGPQLVADRYSYLACLSWSLLLGGAFFRLLRPQTMRTTWQRAFAAAAAIITTLGLGVLTWNQTEVWRSAGTLWQHAIAVTPSSSIAHYNLGRTHERENNAARAVESYRRAIAVNPSHSKAHFNLAGLLFRQGLVDEAMEHYRRVTEIRPDHADAHNNLGLLLEIKGDLEGASSEYQKAISMDPNHDKAFFNLGELLAKQGELAGATGSYQRAALINPNAVEVHVRLAVVLARQGQLEAATGHLVKAVKLKPDYADAHVLLARALAAQGKQAEAEGHYREALRVLKAQGKTPESAARDSRQTATDEKR